MPKIAPPFIAYTVNVIVTAKLDEDFYRDDAEARGTQKDIETSLRRHLDAWEKERHCPLYKPTVDVELTEYDITLPDEGRQKGDDDGMEYGHPREALDDRD
jgi:hypothetical protein